MIAACIVVKEVEEDHGLERALLWVGVEERTEAKVGITIADNRSAVGGFVAEARQRSMEEWGMAIGGGSQPS